MVPPLQEMLQAALRRLQKEQQEAEELEADIREQRTSCKVGGEASYGVSKVVIWARSSVLITRKPLPLVAWQGWMPEAVLSVPPFVLSQGGCWRGGMSQAPADIGNGARRQPLW